MKVKNLILGIEIIAKYDSSVKESYVRAEHDQVWVGGDIGVDEYFERMSEEDKKALDEIIWFVDEDSWSFFC